jgi:glycosyltransferase involved in cell wall biosynthesis
MLLTIGIPTYNRAEDVSRLLHDLLSRPESEGVEIVVIDDGGSDGTYRALSSDPVVSARVRVLRNDVNRGYTGTFARLFDECATEYLMVVADDDRVVAEGIGPLIDHLDGAHPAFASPQFLRGDAVYRGRARTGPIAPREFLNASAHAPGLVYRVEDCRAALGLLAARAADGEADALIYPQVVVLTRLLLDERRCEWIASPTVAEGAAAPSGIRDASGGAYWAVESRWRQLKAFDALLSGYLEKDATGVAREMLDAQRARVFRTIASAIASESPELAAAFDSGAAKAYGPRTPAGIRGLPPVRWLARRMAALRTR